ncbi:MULTISPECIES: DUF4232 domain-containing protein [unclassified Streptomyces]|uniref:DUF4232 domain-containing protein n=1 Tax=unclassified Streptomyces TaxID=2593676 RepID=UPI0003634CBD|nr:MULTISPECIES: DUF4232 domain-containing protein [unclassified Streptomyces]MYT32857.1 DUF4232 domain-containing protein [Streptomyces sp. SID8354]
MPRTDATAARPARTARRRTLRLAAAGLTALAALTLTACGQDNPLKTSDAKPFNPAPQDSEDPAANNAHAGKGDGGSAEKGDGGSAGKGGTVVTESAAGGGKHASTGGAGRPGAGKGQGSGARRTACDAARIRIVAKPLTRPINHLLLQATNTSGATCDLYAYPYLRFDDAQAPLAEMPDSKPQAVVTLAPGESGYAGVLLSGADGGEHGRKATSLSVYLAGRDGQGSVGGPATVALPGGSAYLDDNARVSYWQTDPSTAASW